LVGWIDISHSALLLYRGTESHRMMW